jgi:carbonic anhydrase/acetyltransferase-like protein (isoleucine patch superfamily)
MGFGAIQEIDGRFLSTSAMVQGEVSLGEGTNVWHHAVIRGDVAPITVGTRANIQDATVIHCRAGVPATIGDEVVMGHRVVFHGRSAGPRTLIGIGAIVLDDCRIGQECLIAAGTVLVPGTTVPDGMMVMGTPGKVIREATPAERALAAEIAARYFELARRHAAGEFRPFGPG